MRNVAMEHNVNNKHSFLTDLNNENMTAKEFLEHDNTIWRKIDDSNLTKATLIEFAQAYHESEVKKLGLFMCR